MALTAAFAALAGGVTKASVGAAVGVAGAASSVKDFSDAMADASFGVTGIKGKSSPTVKEPTADPIKNAVSNVQDFMGSLTPKAKPMLSDVGVRSTGSGRRDIVGGSFAALAESGRPDNQGLQLALSDKASKMGASKMGGTSLTSRKVQTIDINEADIMRGGTGLGVTRAPWADYGFPDEVGRPAYKAPAFSVALPWSEGFTDTTPTIGQRTGARTPTGWLYGDNPLTAENENPNGKSFVEFLAGLFSNENANKPAKPNAVPDKQYDWQRILGQPAGMPLLREYNGEDAGIAAIPMPTLDGYQLGSDAPKPPRPSPDVFPFPYRNRNTIQTASLADIVPMPGRPASIDRKVAPVPMPAYLADDAYLGRGGGDDGSTSWFAAPAPLVPEEEGTNYIGDDGTWNITVGSGTRNPLELVGPSVGAVTGAAPQDGSLAPQSGSLMPSGDRGDSFPLADGSGTLPGPGLGLIDWSNLDWWKQAGAGVLLLLVIAALLVYGVRKTLN